jgi:hypothetical protein
VAVPRTRRARRTHDFSSLWPLLLAREKTDRTVKVRARSHGGDVIVDRA